MRKSLLPLILGASLAAMSPASAQTDLGKILSGVAQSLVTQELDKRAFADAQKANTVSAYRSYLSQFPNGAYRVNAEQELAKLGKPVDPVRDPPAGNAGSAAAAEAALGLTRSQRIGIQQQLTSIGYPTGVADGLWGQNTRTAISRWQKANRLSSTGYLTSRQVALIAQQAGSTAGTGGPPATIANDQLEERLLGLTYSERREIQIRLTTLGYSTGGTDGVFGQNTRRALANWQRNEGLRASGYITADQIRELRRQTGG